MSPKLVAVGGWLRQRAENILCLMLLGMFVVFIMQIVFRYLLNLSIGWTHEISVALWIWIVLFGSAFVIRSEEHTSELQSLMRISYAVFYLKKTRLSKSH